MYGLVLEGGGARGSYQIGVYKALLEMNIPIKVVTGTSVGALNGALIAQGKISEGYELWKNINPSSVLEIDENIFNELIDFDIKKENIKKYYAFIKSVLLEKGLNIEPLKNLIKEYVDEDILRKSDIDFGLVTVSLSDLRPLELFIEDIPIGQIQDYLLASAYLPGFKNERLNGKIYIDGGVYNNAPINMIIKKNIKNIIVVRLDAIGIKRVVKDRDVNIIEIVPTAQLGSILKFNEDQAKANIELGYYDALRVFKYKQNHLYCISSIPDEDYFVHLLMNLENFIIENLALELEIKFAQHKRALFEKIIPEICKVFNCDETFTYKEVAIFILEEIAFEYCIDRFKEYDYKTFVELIIKADKTREGKCDSLINTTKKNKIIKREYNKSFFKRLLGIYIGIS